MTRELCQVLKVVLVYNIKLIDCFKTQHKDKLLTQLSEKIMYVNIEEFREIDLYN
jgi:hypothetical protein